MAVLPTPSVAGELHLARFARDGLGLHGEDFKADRGTQEYFESL